MLTGLLNGNQVTEKKIVEMMLADYSWEQVVYDIIASQGMDPWNLDLNTLSQSFLSYMNKIQELDFRIPAKYVIISSVILRMKSENLKLLDIPSADGTEEVDDYLDGQQAPSLPIFNLGLFSLQESRRPSKQIMVSDLILSLKKALGAQEMRELRMAAAKSTIKISADSIIDRINSVYKKINSLFSSAKNEEVPFSNVVEKWERKAVVENFLPLIYLDNEKKINCRQEQFFDEIYIKKTNGLTKTRAEASSLAEEMKRNMNIENKIHTKRKKSRKQKK